MVRRIFDFLLADRRAVWGLAGLWVALCALAVSSDLCLRGEGVRAWTFSTWQTDDFLPAFFFQWTRPAWSVLYAPVAALGLGPYLYTKVLVTSTAIPMVAALARRGGQRRPNVPALITALSPLMLASACAGVSAVDALFGAVLAAWLLLCRGRPAAAGAVSGVLLLGNVALLVVPVALAVHLLPEERRSAARFLLAACAAPALYLVAGAVYHEDPLWALRFPPWLLAPGAAGASAAWAGYAGGVTKTTLLTPIASLLAFVRPASLRPPERAAALIATLLLLTLPAWAASGLLTVSDAPRCLLPALPFVALVLGRVLERFEEGDARAWFPDIALLLYAVAVFLASEPPDDPVPHLLLMLTAAVIGLVKTSRPRLALCVALGGVIVLVPPMMKGTRLTFEERAEVAQTQRWIAAQGAGRPVVTDVRVLSAYLSRHGSGDREVRYLATADEMRPLEFLTDERVGQREAIHALFRRGFYGTPIAEPLCDPRLLSPGTLVVLDRDSDAPGAGQRRQRWRGRLLEVSTHGSIVISEVGGPR